MLKPAQLYESELQKKNFETWYNTEYMYWNGGTGDVQLDIKDNNYELHQFASVDKYDNVIGYISYSIDWCAMSADRFGIISFDRGNVLFAKDVYKAICDLFEKYHMNRVSWFAFADNPAIRGYRNFIKKHGGVECAYCRQVARLTDGKLHDSVEFEILASEFKRGKAKPIIKNKNQKEEKPQRNKLDYGKIMALHNAGWSNKKIADEMGTTSNTIAVIICNLKKRERSYE